MRPKRTGNSVGRSLKSAIAFLILASASLAEAQILQTLCSFDLTNGSRPLATLTLGTDGNFYGTTALGGADNYGTVFKTTTNGGLTTLVSFHGSDGSSPDAALTLGADGNFYGTTSGGGTRYCGTIYKITTNGTLTTLASFNGSNGSYPRAALTLGTDGSFYGTTRLGGTSNYGTVFKIRTDGGLTTLVSFSGINGSHPHAALTLGADGNFYGTTSEGGFGGNGTVFAVTTNGELLTLVAFAGRNGAYPEAALTLGTDGNFYGTTLNGGTSGFGTVFKVTTNGTFTTLTSFNGSNNSHPEAALTLGTDGNFCGTTSEGAGGNGTVFQITTNGELKTLDSFHGSDGSSPDAALTLGADGNFYSTTSRGGTSGNGTVFRLLTRPVITGQPQSQSRRAGETVTFSVGANGLNPMVCQWQRNGTNLIDGGNVSGANTDTLTIASIADSDAASYAFIVSNSYGTTTSYSAVLTVNDLPFIASQPQSQTVGVGSNVTFSVTVYGAPPFVFQWYCNGTPVGSPITGTNSSCYSLTNVGTNQAGNYRVLVVNDYGSVTSFTAVLTVKVFPPIIGLQPSSQSVMLGSSASFGLSVSGTPPFSYQWRFNGTNLLNATNAAYAIQVVAATNTGKYSVVVTNSAGSATSSNALLTVIVPPTLALQFLAGYPLLDLSGMLSSNFVVQYRMNLAGTNWVNLLSLTNLPSSPYQFLDSGGVGQPLRFYRAFMR